MKVHRKFLVPIYGITFIINFDPNLHNKLSGSEIDPMCYKGVVTTTPGYPMVITFDPGSYKSSLAVHESIHAAWRVLDFVEVLVDSENQEALCYLSEWIFDQIERYYKELNSKQSFSTG